MPTRQFYRYSARAFVLAVRLRDWYAVEAIAADVVQFTRMSVLKALHL